MKNFLPGAGLPDFERLFIKYFLVPMVRLVFTWKIAHFLIHREVKIIEKLINKVSKKDLQKRVFINRAFAIEDHSRDYSINMCLEHLRITGSAIIRVIESLTNEVEFKSKITIEAVKPKDNSEYEAEKFFEFMKKYELYLKNHKKNFSKITKRHPWFVNFNNFDWVCFMFMHTFIHRRQIETILERINE